MHSEIIELFKLDQLGIRFLPGTVALYYLKFVVLSLFALKFSYLL